MRLVWIQNSIHFSTGQKLYNKESRRLLIVHVPVVQDNILYRYVATLDCKYISECWTDEKGIGTTGKGYTIYKEFA